MGHMMRRLMGRIAETVETAAASVRAFSRLAAMGAVLAAAVPAQLLVAGPVFGNTTLIPRLLSRALRPLIGLKVTFNGAAMERERHPLVYIANHLSYLDPLILGRHFPATYVCQDGAKDWPVIGRFCAAIGTIFVRRDAAGLARMQGDMVRVLNDGRDVAIFPEGHISDGRDVLPFYNGALSMLFNNLSGVAMQEKPLVQPLALRIDRVDGKDVAAHPELRAVFAWASPDMGMGAHLWRLMHARRVEMTVTALPVMDPADYKDRRSFTAAAYDAVRGAVTGAEIMAPRSRIEIQVRAEPQPQPQP